MPNITTEESILNSMKKLLSMPQDYTAFDTDLIIHINSYISMLRSMGVGKNGVTVTDATTTWDDLLGTQESLNIALSDSSYDLKDVPSWMYTKLRLIFDPPANSFVVSSLNDLCKELEFHIYMTGEHIRTVAPDFWG